MENFEIERSDCYSVGPSLADVSTRDLLNEAFRRGAIKQFCHFISVTPSLNGNQENPHFKRQLATDSLLQSIEKLEDFGVFNIVTDSGQNVMSADYFICMHPQTLKAR